MMSLNMVFNRSMAVERHIEKFHQEAPGYMLPEQAKVIQDFDRLNKVNDISVLTRRNYIRTLKWMVKVIKKPFDKMTKQDLEIFIDEVNRSISPSTAKVVKIQTKRFFKYIYDMDDYPDVVKWISTKKSTRHREPVKKILSLKDRKAMLNACKNQRDRAIISFLDQTGCRAEELRMTRIGDVIPDENRQFMTINLGKGKTGRRRIVVTEGIGDIQTWINLHPQKHDLDAPLFISLSRCNKFKGLHPSGLNDIIDSIAANAELNRKVYPHLFRHTRATIYGKISKWNEARMRIYFGWVRGSQMPSVYTHLNDEDVNELILIESGIKKGTEIKEMDIKDAECPRCHSKNPFDAKYCHICSLALDSKIAEKHTKIIKISDEIMDTAQEKNMEIEKAVEKYVEKLKMKIINDLKAEKENHLTITLNPD